MTSTPQKPNAVVFGADISRCVKDFIALPKRLYSARERTRTPIPSTLFYMALTF